MSKKRQQKHKSRVAKLSKARRDRQVRPSSVSGTESQSTLPAIDYSGFGPLGPKFQALHLRRWQFAVQEYKKRNRKARHSAPSVATVPSFGESLATLADRSGYLWIQMYIGASRLGKEGELLELWNELRLACDPHLTSAAELRVANLRRRDFVSCYSAAVSRVSGKELSRACFGPYSEDEMRYLLSAHPRIVEGGAGSGYFLAEYNRRGGDGIGFDSNLYTLASDPEHGEFWTRKMLDDGRLLISEEIPADDIFRDRALLLSWPYPGSDFPLQLLKRYRAAGGKTLLFKIGGYAFATDARKWRNVCEFFRCLAREWQESRDPLRPPYRLRMVENNLLVFEAR